MTLHDDVFKAWESIAHPDLFFEKEKTRIGYWPVLRFYLLLNIVLALLTPFIIWLGFPQNIIHAGTNGQMGAFMYAPLLEALSGINRYIWAGILTYLLNTLKFPLIGFIYHIVARVLRGSGSLLDSFKVGIYATTPVLLFGWIPYFGLISGLWVGYLYVIALNQLHGIKWGPAIAIINFFIGIQVVWAFTFGWFGSEISW